MPVSSNGTRHTRTSTIAAQNTNLQNIAWALYYNQILKRTIQIVFSIFQGPFERLRFQSTIVRIAVWVLAS